jgi:hypothetical protein
MNSRGRVNSTVIRFGDILKNQGGKDNENSAARCWGCFDVYVRRAIIRPIRK